MRASAILLGLLLAIAATGSALAQQEEILSFESRIEVGADGTLTARRDVEGTLAVVFQGRRMEELGATARYTAEHPDEEKEARFLAFRKDVELGESRMRETEDGLYDAGERDDGG